MSNNGAFPILDTQNPVKIGEKVAKVCPQGIVRRKLADISNLKEKPEMLIQVEKPRSIPTTTKEYVHQLQKENGALKQLLAQRNKIIEQTGIELDRLGVNLLKMQEQNKRLSLQNTQMIADLNSGKDRLKALQHEIGCKNGMLKALKLESEAKERTRTCKNVDIKCSKEDKPFNTKRSSQSNNPGSPNEVQSKEIAVNKRPCTRRQSCRFKAVDLNPAEDMLEINDMSLPPRPSQKRSTSITLPVKNEDIKSMQCPGKDKPCNTKRSLQSNNPGSPNEVQPKENAVNKRPCVRRQSARFKTIDLKPTKDLLEINDLSLPSCPSSDSSDPQRVSTSMTVSVINEDNEQVHSKEKHENKRFKATELKPAEYSFEMDDVIVTQKGSSSGNETIKNEENDCSSGHVYESKEFRRSSLSRPSRVAAKKVQSYKEIPVNLKMRRPQ